jgi:hypothetical protein
MQALSRNLHVKTFKKAGRDFCKKFALLQRLPHTSILQAFLFRVPAATPPQLVMASLPHHGLRPPKKKGLHMAAPFEARSTLVKLDRLTHYR